MARLGILLAESFVDRKLAHGHSHMRVTFTESPLENFPYLESVPVSTIRRRRSVHTPAKCIVAALTELFLLGREREEREVGRKKQR